MKYIYIYIIPASAKVDERLELRTEMKYLIKSSIFVFIV